MSIVGPCSIESWDHRASEKKWVDTNVCNFGRRSRSQSQRMMILFHFHLFYSFYSLLLVWWCSVSYDRIGSDPTRESGVRQEVTCTVLYMVLCSYYPIYVQKTYCKRPFSCIIIDNNRQKGSRLIDWSINRRGAPGDFCLFLDNVLYRWIHGQVGYGREKA